MKSYLTKTNILFASLLGLICWFVISVESILMPFILAFVLAYVLHPMVVGLEKCKMGRGTATSLVVSGFCLFVIAVLLIIVPILQTQIFDFIVRIPQFSSSVWAHIKEILAYTKDTMSPDQLEDLSNTIGQSIISVLNTIGSTLKHVLSSGIAVFNVIALIVITPVVLFYVLRDWNGIRMQIKELVPTDKKEEVQSIWKEINRTLSGFIRGQSMVCLLLGAFYGIGLSFVGLEFGILVGLLSGLLSFIPYFGFGTGLLLSLFLGLVQGFSLGQWIGLTVVFSVGQILEGYILTPYLVGNKVGLHPVWVIFALLAGGVLAGFVGILVAVPVAAIIGILLRRTLKWYKTTPIYRGKSSSK